PKTLTIQIDKTPPNISGTRAPAPNANGWNNTNVSINFQCTDVLSGLAPGSPPTPTVLSAEGAAQSVSGTCQDLAGNSAIATVSEINIDKTPPLIAITSPGNAATFTFATAVPATYSCTDALSGLASCSGSVANGANLNTST